MAAERKPPWRISKIAAKQRWRSSSSRVNIEALRLLSCSLEVVELQGDFEVTFGRFLGAADYYANPSFKPRPNGGPPGPVWWYAVRFHLPGSGVPPLVPPHLKR